MNILITGGNGFIGSHVIKKLQDYKNHRYLTYDNLSNSKNDLKNANLIIGDILDKEKLNKLFSNKKFKIDAVIHLAAQISVNYSIDHPVQDCQTNLIGLLNLLECCVDYDVNKFIFASSAAVYGDKSKLPILESEDLNPSSPYGITKATSESYLKFYSQEFGINTIVFRFANVYGERQAPWFNVTGGVISEICKKSIQGKQFTINGDGTQTRDFIHADDIADAIIKSLELDKKFEIINLSTGTETSLNQLVEEFKKLDKDFKFSHTNTSISEIYKSSLDNTKYKSLLNGPQISLSEGLKKTYQWYLDNMK